MQTAKKKIKYPDNRVLLIAVKSSGRSVSHLAEKLNLSREVVSLTINGHYKGENIKPLLMAELNITDADLLAFSKK